MKKPLNSILCNVLHDLSSNYVFSIYKVLTADIVSKSVQDNIRSISTTFAMIRDEIQGTLHAIKENKYL